MDDRQNCAQSNREAGESASKAMNKFRFEAGGELAPSLLTGYRDGISLGGFATGGSFSRSYLVRRMIEAQEKQMENQGK
ncbi:MAG: alpha/beta-type small acid-soluble spore protein [Clostridiales bacterium]|jgi:hypothetical protein|nr:alpha/beta-type small acid-soluble spore protein [Clostridiales bacterium]